MVTTQEFKKILDYAVALIVGDTVTFVSLDVEECEESDKIIGLHVNEEEYINLEGANIEYITCPTFGGGFEITQPDGDVDLVYPLFSERNEDELMAWLD